jgi:predicted amidohydrolase YtcJ
MQRESAAASVVYAETGPRTVARFAGTTLRCASLEPDEAIKTAEALCLYTIYCRARVANRADQEGSIVVGQRANLLVLDRDIVTCPPYAIRR